jgi:hypothetical protein
VLAVAILRQLWLPFVAGRIVVGVQHDRLLTGEALLFTDSFEQALQVLLPIQHSHLFLRRLLNQGTNTLALLD